MARLSSRGLLVACVESAWACRAGAGVHWAVRSAVQGMGRSSAGGVWRGDWIARLADSSQMRRRNHGEKEVANTVLCRTAVYMCNSLPTAKSAGPERVPNKFYKLSSKTLQL